MEGLFEYDEHGRDTRRPAWLCACGTTIHPARLSQGGIDRTPPRCPACTAHGVGGKYEPRPVTLTISEGWAS